MPDGERTDEIPQGEEDEVVGGVGGRDVVDLGQHQRVGEEDGVVEERLGDHQGGPENGPPRVVDEERSGQGDEADVAGRCDLDGLGLVDLTEAAAAVLGVPSRSRRRPASASCLPAVHEEPARALGQVLAHEEDDEARAPGRTGRPPATSS